jgi:predicted negative regulator of RcsB-dependent stress response
MTSRHPTSRRVHRETAPDDAFIARVIELTAWAKRNSRLVTIGATLAVVLVAGVAYYVNYQRTVRNQAAIEIMQVRQAAAIGNHALAIRDLDNFLNRFGGTPAANEARILLGQVHLQAGNAEQAIEALQPLARNPSRTSGAAAAFLLGAAQELADAHQAAAATNRTIPDRPAL